MKHNLCIISIAVLAFSLSCTNLKQKAYPGIDFPHIGELRNGDTVVYDIPTDMVMRMYIIDSLALCHCFNTLDNKLIHVYNINTGDFIASFGSTGRGPGEIDLSYSSLKYDERILQIITGHTSQNIKFFLDSIIKGVNHFTSIPLDIRPNSDIFSFKDSLLISDFDFRKKHNFRFAIMGPKGDTIFCYRDGTRKIDSPFAISPDYSKLFTYTNGNFETEVFYLTQNRIDLANKINYIDPERVLDPETVKNKDFPGLSSHICAKYKYIYAGWTNSLKTKGIDRSPNKLLIFDWTGKAIGFVTIENQNHFFWMKDVDEVNKKIYILIKNSNGQLNIVRYDMSHLPL
ncbi:MAG: hypothetical protein IKY70_08035 [Bacteroidales bacterium]|nr:hypothetical protein [Bacteroidales bacterium]